MRLSGSRGSASAAPLVWLRSYMLQQAALILPGKSLAVTKKGPGRMPRAKTQRPRVVIYRGVKRKMLVPRLMRATGPNSLDAHTERRKEQWLAKQKLRTT